MLISLAGLISHLQRFMNCNFFSSAIIPNVYTATAAKSPECDQMWGWDPASAVSHRQTLPTAIGGAKSA